MPNIKDDSTVEAIARAFTSNGRVRCKALQEVGYSVKYSEHAGLKLLDNVRVKAAIARIDGKGSVKAERTVQSLDEMYQDAYDTSLLLKQPSAMVSAVTGIARLYGMDKDNEIGGKAPDSISAEQAERYSAMAAIANQERLQGPKLSKEAV